MEIKVKYNYGFKRRCVEEIIKEHHSVNSVAIKKGLDNKDLNPIIYLITGKPKVTIQRKES